MRLFAVIVLILFCLGRASAQSTLTQNLSSAKPPQFSGNLGLSYNSNLYNANSNQKLTSASADLVMNYRLKDANLLRAYLSGYKQFTQNEEWRANDGFVGWVNNRFWAKGEKYSLGQQVRLILPLSRESLDRDHRYTGVSVVPVFNVTLTPSVVFIYQPQFIRNFHKYTVNEAGTNNTAWAMNQTFILSWSFLDAWYLQGIYVHGSAWNYQGSKKDDTYQVGGELGRSLTQTITLALGWSNAGALHNWENGNDQTIRVFDNSTSTVYGSLYWIF